jgi:3-oxoacyl-[acyl-carrier-protein] synthase-3
VRMGDGVVKAAEDAGWRLDEIDLVIPHQANIRIIDAVRRRIGASEDKIFANIHKYGNTSAATIPIGLSEALDEGTIKPGAKVIFVAFGAGFTWGASAFQWGDRVDPIETVEDGYGEPEKTALEMMIEKQRVFS